MPKLISDLKHPDYELYSGTWESWRLAYKGGEEFIQSFLYPVSQREKTEDFQNRLKQTYAPMAAKSAILEIRNAIFDHLHDIKRINGSKNYLDKVEGNGSGVDLHGKSMAQFMGLDALEEALVMGKVGIVVDMPSELGPTLADTYGKSPYLYLYPRENILNWDFDKKTGKLIKLLLKQVDPTTDSIYGFPTATLCEIYKCFFINEFGTVTCHIIDADNNLINEIFLNLPEIPFHWLDIGESFMADIYRAQIALLNISSSDINYILNANFPLYVEQRDLRVSPEFNEGESERTLGPTYGIYYNQGLDAPNWIAPPSEPLKASMDKQDQIKRDIRMMVGLHLSELGAAKSQSGTSKEMDRSTLESGLSAIGLILEYAEQQIAKFWSYYENSTPATIIYPEQYHSKLFETSLEESERLFKLKRAVPSSTYTKEISKLISYTLLDNKVTRETLDTIDSEIEKSKTLDLDSTTIGLHLERGLVDSETLSTALGYPSDAVKKAKKEHIERLAEIAKAQSSESNLAARGLTRDSQQAKQEKAESQNPDLSPNKKKPVRGKSRRPE